MVKFLYIMKELFDKFNILSLVFLEWLGGVLRVNFEVFICKFNGSCFVMNCFIFVGYQVVIGFFIFFFDCIFYIKRFVICYFEVLIMDVYWFFFEKLSY